MVVENPERESHIEDTSEFKAAQLAPLEESTGEHRTDTDTIQISTGDLQLPKNLIGVETDTARVLRPHRVVVVIIGLLLLFVAFIMYLVSQMSTPAN